MWKRQNRGCQKVWEVAAWQVYPWLKHGFTWRASGDMLVEQNRETLARSTNLSVPWVTAQQVHGDHVEVVNRPYSHRYLETDGLITDQSGIVLATFYADCVPLFFIDPEQKVVGTIHAGWRGTYQKIGVKAAAQLIAQFSSNISDVQVGIGPSIGPCCFNVQSDVADLFPTSNSTTSDGSLSVNLWQANVQQLIDCGIKAENIHLAKQCTVCSPEFFSYRRDKTPKRMGALISIVS